MGSATKQKNDRYQRSVKIDTDENGKPIRKFFTATTLREVDAMVAEFKNQQKQGLNLVNTDMTFAEMGHLWLAQYKCYLSGSSYRRYASIQKNHLNPVMGDKRLQDLKPLHLKTIINGLAEKGYSMNTMAEIKQTAAQVMEAALENDMIIRNVFSKVAVPSAEAPERMPIDEATRRLILETCTEHRMGIPALIMLYTGIRKGELLALKWEDIDLDEERLTVNKAVAYHNNQGTVKTPKTRAGTRSVPIPTVIITLLQKGKREAKSEFVCPSVKGKMMSHTAYHVAWNSYQHFLNLKAGGRVASRSRPKVQAIQPFTSHQLRHTFCSTLYDAGVDVKSAQKFLGHSDIHVTLKIYTHLSVDKEKEAVDTLNGYLVARGDAPVLKSEK